MSILICPCCTATCTELFFNLKRRQSGHNYCGRCSDAYKENDIAYFETARIARLAVKTALRLEERLIRGTKQCFRCKQYLPFQSFGGNKNKIDGYNGACKSCVTETRTAADKRYNSKIGTALTDAFVKKNITSNFHYKFGFSIPHSQLPKELIDATRIALEHQRFLKEQK